MALLDPLDITEVLTEICRGTHEFSDAGRTSGQLQLRDIIADRVFIGRRPSQYPGPFVLFSVVNVVREYALSGECEDAETTVLCSHHSMLPREVTLMRDGFRQAMTSYTGTVTLPSGGTVYIGGATFESEQDLLPETPTDGSEEFGFQYQQFLRLTHEIDVAATTT